MSGKRHEFSKEFKACDQCHGKGTVDCSSCDGRGYREVTRSGYDAYGRSYSDKERERCTVCGGTGQRRCSYCSGTGDQRDYASKYSDTGESADSVTDRAPSETDSNPLSAEERAEEYRRRIAELELGVGQLADWLEANNVDWVSSNIAKVPLSLQWAMRQLDVTAPDFVRVLEKFEAEISEGKGTEEWTQEAVQGGVRGNLILKLSLLSLAASGARIFAGD